MRCSSRTSCSSTANPQPSQVKVSSIGTHSWTGLAAPAGATATASDAAIAGSLWVSNYKGNSVSVVRPGSERPETVPVPDGPLGIAAGEGGIWVVTFWNAEMVRIDPETRRVRARIPIGDGPLDVTVGGGAVWTTDRDSQMITKVDPATDKVVATIHLPVAPYGIRFARGRLWVTTQRCGSPVTPCG